MFDGVLTGTWQYQFKSVFECLSCERGILVNTYYKQVFARKGEGGNHETLNLSFKNVQ